MVYCRVPQVDQARIRLVQAPGPRTGTSHDRWLASGSAMRRNIPVSAVPLRAVEDSARHAEEELAQQEDVERAAEQVPGPQRHLGPVRSGGSRSRTSGSSSPPTAASSSRAPARTGRRGPGSGHRRTPRPREHSTGSPAVAASTVTEHRVEQPQRHRRLLPHGHVVLEPVKVCGMRALSNTSPRGLNEALTSQTKG